MVRVDQLMHSLPQSLGVEEPFHNERSLWLSQR